MDGQRLAKEATVEQEHTLFIADLELVRKAQAGDTAAFKQLYHQHLGHIYAVCMRMLADAEEAQEVMQRTVIQAWTMLRSYRGHRIAVRLALDHMRSRKRLTARVEFTDAIEQMDVPESRSADDRIDIDWAITLLPPQARAVLVLHDVEGYNHEEIAAMLDVVPGTCKAQLHRARRLLREVLSR